MKEQITLSVVGMTCSHCTARVEKSLKSVNGVKKVKVNLEQANAVVTGANIDEAALRAAIEEAGYTVG